MIADRSGAAAASRGADFDLVDDRRPAFPIARARRRVRRAARPSDFSSASMRAAAAGSGAAAAGLRGLGLDAGDPRGEPIDRGGIDLRRGRRGGGPRAIPASSRRRSPARRRPAPEIARDDPRRTSRGRRRPLGGAGSGSAFGAASAPSSACGSRWRPRWLPGRWSAARAWAGPNPATAVQRLPACHRPSRRFLVCNRPNLPDSADPRRRIALLARSGPQSTVQRLEQGIFVRRRAPP